MGCGLNNYGTCRTQGPSGAAADDVRQEVAVAWILRQSSEQFVEHRKEGVAAQAYSEREWASIDRADSYDKSMELLTEWCQKSLQPLAALEKISGCKTKENYNIVRRLF